MPTGPSRTGEASPTRPEPNSWRWPAGSAAGSPCGSIRALVLEATGGLGLHVWVLLAVSTPAGAVVALLDEALADLGLTPAARITLDERFAVERYPKRAEPVADQVGSALRLPLGRHPRTGRRSTFLDPASGEPAAPGPMLHAPGAVLEPAPAPRPAPPRPEDPPRGGNSGGRRRYPAPDAWLTYRWLAARRGLEATEAPPPEDGRGHPVRCLFPDAHAPGDRSPGSAYLIRRGDTQLYGCAVCGGGRAMDTIALIRRVYPALDFRDALALCHEIDPGRCPASRRMSERDRSSASETSRARSARPPREGPGRAIARFPSPSPPPSRTSPTVPPPYWDAFSERVFVIAVKEKALT